jgi:hypothetical protein
MIADRDAGDAGAGRLDDARALVAEDPREHRVGEGVLEVDVGVAEPRCDDPDEDFVHTRAFEFHVLQREVAARFVDDRHNGLHASRSSDGPAVDSLDPNRTRGFRF